MLWPNGSLITWLLSCFWNTRPRFNSWPLFIFTRGVRPYVCTYEKQKRTTTDTTHENNDHLLVGAWWVILNSLVLFQYVFFLLFSFEPLSIRQMQISRLMTSHPVLSYTMSCTPCKYLKLSSISWNFVLLCILCFSIFIFIHIGNIKIKNDFALVAFDVKTGTNCKLHMFYKISAINRNNFNYVLSWLCCYIIWDEIVIFA